MKKDFITDKLGMYGNPEGNFVITGGSNVSRTPITTKYLQDQIIATTADGTTKMLPPGVDNIELPSNTVLEMKYQMGAQVNDQQQQLMQLISAYCQVVGGGDSSCAEKVAQSLQKNPEKMIQQMTATIQQAQQEQGMQQEEAEEDEMMRGGGCIDCQEQFPQAQNLNWFYKAQGGEAFPQANMYPLSWADYTGMQYALGGNTEAFPQAQTYLPYDRLGETRLNGMFQKGGTLYDYVKSIGMDPSYQSRKKLFSQFFDEPYTGTAEQNMYLLKALKTGKVSLAEKPKLGSVGFSKSQSFFNANQPTPAAPSKKPSYKVAIPGVTKAERDSPRMTSPLVGIPVASTKRSVLPKAEEAQKEADKRAVPQSGVIIDKRSGEAVVLGPGGATIFPVLTGRNVESNVNTYTLDELTPERMATPTGYYMLENANAEGKSPYTGEFEGNVGSWLTPIPAYGQPAPLANNLVMHGTFDPKVRNPLYTAPPEQRNVSMGCVNCGPTDFQHMMGTLGGPDTVMVVDSKRPEDLRLFNQAKQQAESRMNSRNQYSVVATEPRGYTTTGYEYGGQTLQEVYQMMKRGGLNYNPKKKKGGQETFEQYMMRMGGLAKYQAENSQVGPPTEYDDFAQRSTPIYDETETDYELPADDSGYDSDLGPDLGIMGDYDPTDLFNATRSGRRIERRAQRQKMREQRRGVREERQKLNQYFRDNPSIPAKPQTGVPATGTAQQTNTGQPGAGQQQQQNQGFGPGSQYDLTVKQRQAANPLLAYNRGRNLTNMFGNQFGAGVSILNALGATAGSMFGRGRSSFKAKSFGPGRELLDKVKARGSAADFAAQGLFGRMAPQQQGQLPNGCFPGGPCTQVPADIVNQVMSQQTTAQTPDTQAPSAPAPGSFSFVGPPVFKARGGQMSYLQPGGQGGIDFRYSFRDPSQMNVAAATRSAGIADGFRANYLEELNEQAMNRGAMATAPITTATKTQMGSPQGAVNAPSFAPSTTEASRATDAYMPERLMFTQMGGMLEGFDDDDDETYDLSDMTPAQRAAFIRQVYAAGGTIEFI